MSYPSGPVTLRTDLKPGDIGRVIWLHGVIYSEEHGFDPSFEAYVPGPLSQLVRRGSPRERLWIAEHDGRLVGSIAIVETSPEVAQLRWFLVDPSIRGAGVGKCLLKQAVDFCESIGYRSIFLWTVRVLATAAHLYRSIGFERVEERPGRSWGVDVIEERYGLDLDARRAGH